MGKKALSKAVATLCQNWASAAADAPVPQTDPDLPAYVGLNRLMTRAQMLLFAGRGWYQGRDDVLPKVAIQDKLAHSRATYQPPVTYPPATWTIWQTDPGTGYAYEVWGHFVDQHHVLDGVRIQTYGNLRHHLTQIQAYLDAPHGWCRWGRNHPRKGRIPT